VQLHASAVQMEYA